MATGARVCFVCVLAFAAQSSDPRGSYRHRVDAYRSGAEVGDADLAIRPVGLDETNAWTPEDLEAAAMLHTDVCLRLVKDHRETDARAQLDAAVSLLRAATARAPERVEFATRWRDTVSGLLGAFDASDLAGGMQAHGSEWWPASKQHVAAEAAFAKGLTLEIQAAVAGRLSGPAPTRAILIPPAGVSALHSAQEQYLIAVDRDPGYPEAELHLGRIAVVLGRDAEALPHLRIASQATSRPVCYLALLFIGVVSERAGRLDDAAEQYRLAHAAFHWGQSAPLALSHVLMRTGSDAEARTMLSDHFRDTQGRAVDPLWTYLADPSTDLGPTLNELRAETWR